MKQCCYQLHVSAASQTELVGRASYGNWKRSSTQHSTKRFCTYDQTHVVTTEWPLSVEGCNFFRQRQVLATLSGRAIKITKIRVDDVDPGLRGGGGGWVCAIVCVHTYQPCTPRVTISLRN